MPRTHAFFKALLCTVLAGTLVKPTVLAQSDTAFIRVYAPNAHSVYIDGNAGTWAMPGIAAGLEETGEGYWELKAFPVTPGFHYYSLFVNGVNTINPLDNPLLGSRYIDGGVEVPDEDSLFYSLMPVPHGLVRTHYYTHEVSGQLRLRQCHIYLPPGYDTRDDESFPVLYLQHGNSEDEYSWIEQGRMNFIMDNLIGSGMAVPMIVVMDDGMNINYPSLYLNTLNHEIETHYKTKPGPENRAIAGLSMGGTQAGLLVLNNQDEADYLGIFGSWLTMGGLSAQLPTLNENLELFWYGYGEGDEFSSNFNAFLNNLDAERINHKVEIYSGGHEWQVWRKCLRDFAMLVFKPYQYENPYSEIDVQETDALSVYPNPTSGNFRIDLPKYLEDHLYRASLITTDGRLIYHRTGTAAQHAHYLSALLAATDSGIYHLTLESPEAYHPFTIVRN